ncbi:MAG: lysylphosphatidylglycerol synthase transmembrane domain-containing protein [Polyangiaceae bacterium]
MTSAPRSRNALRWLVRLLGPLVLVVLLWRFRGAGEVLRTLRGADLLLVAGAVLLNGPMFLFKVLRWQALLRARRLDYPTSRAWTSFMSSAYLGMVTPGRVGDAVRAQYLRHDLGLDYSKGLAIVLVDRLCDLYVLALFVAVGMARFGAVIAGSLAWLLWLGVALTVVGPAVLLVPGLAEGLTHRAWAKLRPGRAAVNPDPGSEDGAEAGAGGLASFLETLRALVSVRLAWPLAITVVAFAVNYLQGWLLASAIGLHFGFVDVLSLMAIASMLSLLPVSISGVGVRELFFALAFPVLGATPEAGVSYGLLVFASMHVVVAAAGFVSWMVAPPPVGAGAGATARAASPAPE